MKRTAVRTAAVAAALALATIAGLAPAAVALPDDANGPVELGPEDWWGF